MEPSAPPVQAQTPPAARSRWRLAAVGVALAALGAAAWGLHARRVAESAPEALFDHVRERVEAGDGAALWRVMLPRAREDYVNFLRDAATRTDTRTEDWRRRAGFTREDLKTLPPETLMARENLAYAQDYWIGARVYRVDRWDEHTALLRISTRSGDDRNWLVRRVDGAWRMDNFQPMILPDGSVRPRPGEEGRKGTVPVDGFPTGPPLVRPSEKR